RHPPALPALPDLPARAQGAVPQLLQAARAGLEDLPVLRVRGHPRRLDRPAGVVELVRAPSPSPPRGGDGGDGVPGPLTPRRGCSGRRTAPSCFTARPYGGFA